MKALIISQLSHLAIIIYCQKSKGKGMFRCKSVRLRFGDQQPRPSAADIMTEGRGAILKFINHRHGTVVKLFSLILIKMKAFVTTFT